MGRRLVPDVKRAVIAGGATIAALALAQFAGGQVLIIIVSGLVGWVFLRNLPMPTGRASIAANIPKWLAISSLVIFFGLLGMIPLLEHFLPSNHFLSVFYAFFRLWRSCLRRRPCCSTFASLTGCRPRMGIKFSVSGGIRLDSSNAWANFHF